MRMWNRIPIAALTALASLVALVASPVWAAAPSLHDPWAPQVSLRVGVPIVLPLGPAWNQKVDFAYLEHYYPVPKQALAELTPEALASWDQESLDQLYARLPSG